MDAAPDVYNVMELRTFSNVELEPRANAALSCPTILKFSLFVIGFGCKNIFELFGW